MERRKKPLAEEGLEIEWWPIDKPKPYGKNPKKHGALEMEKLKRSLIDFGFRQPIVVDKDGIIVVGHGRLMAAVELGMTRVPVHVAADLSEAKCKAYRLMDNRVSQDGEWDDNLLQMEILDLSALQVDLKSTGFDQEEIAELRPVSGWEVDSKEGAATRKTKSSKGDRLEFRIVIDCENEQHQAELIERFQTEGLKSKPLIS